MGSCPGGAKLVPDPAHAGEAIWIQVAAIALDAMEIIEAWYPAVGATSVLAMMPVTTLCNTDPLDPGDLTPDLFLGWNADGVPGPNATNGTFAKWIYDKALYATVHRYCICQDTSLPPPAPTTGVQQPGGGPYPTGTDTQPQLDRIENNLSSSNDGLLTVYNGVQVGFADVRDYVYRNRPHLLSRVYDSSWSMVGEGNIALPGVSFGTSTVIQDTLGIQVDLTSIPSTVKRRGTTYQRLYGVGSIEWNVEPDSSNPHVIAQRDALHYEHQFVRAPQLNQCWSVRWRLMPGVMATGWIVERKSDSAFYNSQNPYSEALLPVGTWRPNSAFEDPPFYPQPATRSYSLPSASPP